MKPNLKTTTAAVAVTGLLGAGLYIAVPAFATSPQSPSAAPTKEHKQRHHPRRAMRGIHGEATVKRKDGFAKVNWQRGELTAVSANTLTVRSADGTSWTWTTTKDTRVRKNKAKAALTALAAKDQVVVFGPLEGTTRTAKAVVVRKK